MNTVEKIGKTVEEAISAALIELNADIDNVTVEVLEEGAKGFLGIGNKDAKVRVTLNEATVTPEKKAENFLSELFKNWGIEVGVTAYIDDEFLKVDLVGDDMGIVIGKRGETLDALQHLTSLYVNSDKDSFIKVSIDTEGYREKRIKTLQDLAKKYAIKVAKTKRNYTFEPMNSYERRIIHASLQDDKYVTTYSIGQSPNRKVVIAYDREQK
ncbi:MAG: protein jag [Ruminococcaceae bacterium]|nr:protein jag [Oscillospiraceae bacterium]